MLKDRVILITGSNGGIGYATAAKCQQLGASVMLHGRDEKQVALAAAHLGEATKYVVADLEDRQSPEQIIEQTIAAFGRIDGLVNNAACLDRNTLETFSDTFFDRIMAVNVRAPLQLIQHFADEVKASGTCGNIVNIGSTNAHCGAHNLLTYSMSKGAMMTATRNLGDAFGGDNIRINQLNVGWTLTESEKKLQQSEGQPEDWIEQIPFVFAPSGNLLTPEQIAQHVAFWLSDNSAPVTGQVVDVEQYPMIGRNKVSQR